MHKEGETACQRERIELKAAIDNLPLSIYMWDTPMRELLEEAEIGDASMVLQVRQVSFSLFQHKRL